MSNLREALITLLAILLIVALIKLLLWVIEPPTGGPHA